nr:amidophosphoribosyltransferase [uncultured Methanoregula sp.]
MCGIVGIIDTKSISIQLFYVLLALQHRGQESTGISTSDGSTLYKFKGNGLVIEVYSSEILSDLKGIVGIGHVRYPTIRENLPENIQPLNFQFQNHLLSIALNGNLVNSDELRSEYERTGQIFTTTSDAEIIAHILINEINTTGNVEDAVRRCMRKIQGSYSVVAMIDGILYGFRDPLGINPFCIGKTENGFIIASESIALNSIDAEFIRDVNPGELIRIGLDGIRSTQIAIADRKAHCVFEYIYFSSVVSVIDGTPVYDVRQYIGKKLFTEAPIIADSVCPVPDSGIAYTIGYSEQSKIPFCEVMIKNRFMGRMFMIERQQAIRIKLNPLPETINGKSIVLIDDSIVKGTSTKRIINLLRENGVREVHMRIGSPAIMAPCYFGVDMPVREELIARNHDEREVGELIGASTLHHISLESLAEAIKMDIDDLCTGCLTGCYPLMVEGEISRQRQIIFSSNL